MNSAAFEKMTKAKIVIVREHLFFSVIAMGVEYIETKSIPTMGTDGKRILYNPDFVDRMTISETVAVIIHEILHVAYLHPLRLKERNPLLWNFACDYVINLIVDDMGLKFPAWLTPLFDKKYTGMSAEEVYNLLRKDPPPGGGGWCLNEDIGGGGDGDGDSNGKKPLWGEVFKPKNDDDTEMSQSELDALEQQTKQVIHRAAEAAKKRGVLPGSMEGLIEAVGKPKIDWKNYIQSWVNGVTPDNYTFAKPNRRVLGNYGVFMPSMEFNGAGVGVLSVDCSGSVSDDELREYAREITGVIDMCKPDKLYIIVHDSIVQDVFEWHRNEDFSSLKVMGRGGTNIQPSFDKAKTFDEEINWMICFTDMGIGDYPAAKDAPDYPVLWAATGPMNAPFGTYIPIRDAI